MNISKDIGHLTMNNHKTILYFQISEINFPVLEGYIHYVQTFCTVLFSNLFYKSRINLIYETYFVIAGVEKNRVRGLIFRSNIFNLSYYLSGSKYYINVNVADADICLNFHKNFLESSVQPSIHNFFININCCIWSWKQYHKNQILKF